MKRIKTLILMMLLSLNFTFLGNYKNETLKINATNNDEEIVPIKISSGRTFSLLLSKDNVVYAWGLWGDGSNVSYSKKLINPTNISKDINLEVDDAIVDIFSGEQHCFILSKQGRVFCMGSGEKKQFGYSDYFFKTTPTELTSMFSLESDDKITYISCGDDFNIALTAKHKILSFGKNENGQLGISANSIEQTVYDITNNFNLDANDYIINVKSGASHSLAYSKNGNVYSWGDNSFGQLGFKDKTFKETPTLIEQIKDNVIDISCGRYTSYVLTNQANLYGFGSNAYGQLANHETIITSAYKDYPYIMNGNFDLQTNEYIVDIESAYYYGFVKTSLNNYYSFGENSSGQLGNSSTLTTSYPQKFNYLTSLPAGDEINSIACGKDHCIASSKSGHILAWGSNLQGQLSEDYTITQAYIKALDITKNFPPIIVISMSTSSVKYKDYKFDINAYYLDNEQIEEMYYYVNETTTYPKSNWIQFDKEISVSEGEGKKYIHVKIVSKKETYYYTSNPIILDHVEPKIEMLTKDSKSFSEKYANGPIIVNVIDDNEKIEIIYTLNGKEYKENNKSISLYQDGNYSIYAKDGASNYSVAIEFTIDTILPTITKIDNKSFAGTSYSTRESNITIEGSEALACYNLGYKGVKESQYQALNDNETTFNIKLKKGVNTLTIYDLAGNESVTYEIIYSPRFFQDTQLLLLVFSSLVALFVGIIIIVYIIKHKKNLIK
ncbi:MAG: hypothetical protein SOU19_08580 [Candidatus Caccosoma sp.]|nr:hypothetical protein [Candidatus Caccosoma sp.]